MDNQRSYIVNKVIPVVLKVNDLVQVKAKTNHLNVVYLDEGELGLVDSISDEMVAIYMIKEHEALEEWGNRILFERDTYDSPAQMNRNVSLTFEIIEEDRMVITSYELERSMYDLERMVKSARQALDNPDRRLDALHRLEAFLKDQPVPRFTEPLQVARWELLEQMHRFQADRGYI